MRFIRISVIAFLVVHLTLSSTLTTVLAAKKQTPAKTTKKTTAIRQKSAVPVAPIPPVLKIINTITLPNISLPGLISEGIDPLKDKLKVIDEFTDIAYPEDGTNVYRFYASPRALYQDQDELKVRPQNWQLFNEQIESQLKPKEKPGYEYSIPTDRKNNVTVRSGDYEQGKITIASQKTQFEQKQEDSTLVTRFSETYPGIDTVFRDNSFKREREIIIKEAPKNISPNETLYFWEEYDLPVGAQVIAGDGTIVTGTHRQGMQTVTIKSPNGVNVRISGAVMFDATITDRDQIDLSPIAMGLSEVLTVKNNLLRIGLEVPASYLLDKRRVYPVTIDPTYYACVEGNGNGVMDPSGIYLNCSITDFYIRAQDGNRDNSNGLPFSVDSNDLYVGLWRNVQNYTRHAIMYFSPNFSTIEGTVRSSTLKMYYRNIGNGNAGGSDLEVKRITRNWDRGNTGQYDYAYFRNNLARENQSFRANANVINTWHSFNATETVRRWKEGSTNYGIMLEQEPAWAQAGALGAGVDNQLLKYDSSSATGTTNPYLEVVMDPPPLPELAHTNTAIPATVRQGERFTASYTIINRGPGRSAPTNVQNFFGVNDYASGLRISTVDVPALNTDQSVNYTVNYDIPANQAVGDYYFSYWIDRADVVRESNESNNKMRGTVTVQNALRSDLRPENASINDSSVLPNEQITLSLDVLNRGNVMTNTDAYVHYFFNRDSVSYDAAQRIGEEDYFPRLDINQSSRESIAYTIPQGTAPGTYYLSYWVDATGRVSEGDENNNRGSFQITVEGGRDLQPIDFAINNPRSMLSGEQIEVGGTLINSGNIATNGAQYRLRIHNLDTNEYFLVENLNPDSLPNLSAGSSRQVTLRGTIPANIPLTGRYNIEILVDSNFAFNELNEGNNTILTPTNITIDRNGYCGGCIGNGGSPPPQEQNIPSDMDNDGHPDVVEGFYGTNINGGQIAPIGDSRIQQKTPTPIDREANHYGGDPVNIRTGSFELTQNDFNLMGRGIPLSITRVYNSLLVDNNNRLGLGWNLSTASFVYEDIVTHNITAYLGESLVASFSTADGITYVPPDGVDATLTRSNNLYTYKTLDGHRYVFARPLTANIGLLTQVIDPNNNINNFDYIFRRDVPLLSRVTDPSGQRQLQLIYGPEADTYLWDKVIEMRSNLDANTPTIVQYLYKDNAGQLLERVKQFRYYQNVPEELVSQFRYDNNNRLTQFEDPRGTILYNEYDGDGRVIRQREFNPSNPRLDADGLPPKIFDFEYSGPDADVVGSATCTTLKSYRDTERFYTEKTCFNSEGLRLSIKNGEGHTSRFNYDGDGMLQAAINANGNQTTYDYDNQRRLILEVPQDTQAWHTEIVYEYYDNFNRLKKKTERANSLLNPNDPALVRVTDYAINPDNGNILSITDPTGAIQHFTYDQFGNVRSVTDKNGNETTYTYDPTNNYVATESITVAQAEGPAQTVIKRYLYDVYGNKRSVTTGRNQTYTYAYDSYHNVRRITDPLQRETHYEYDLENNRTREIAPQNRITEYVYDKDTNEKLLTIRRLGENNATITNHKIYDYVGNLVADVDGRNNQIRYEYNASNRLARVATPTNTVTYTYYPHGLTQSQSDSDNRRTEYAYDARGNVTTKTQFNDNGVQIITQYEYDGLNRNIAIIDPNGNRTAIVYDLMDRPLRTIDAQNNVTQFEYDAAGLKRGTLTSRAVADVNLRNNQGHSTSYFYDGLQRLIKTKNAQNFDTLFLYDEDGNLLRTVDRQNQNAANNDHAKSFVYDEVGRKRSEIDAYGNTIVYTYDIGDRLESRTDEEGRRTVFGYDLFDRLVSETDQENNRTEYTYDENANRTAIIYPDQTHVRYEYDPSNRLQFVIDADGNRREYQYDSADNKIAVVDKNDRIHSFDYDLLGYLSSETNPEGTVTSYVYDRNGNQRVTSTAGKTTEFIYDSLNRVQEIVHPGNHHEHIRYDTNSNIIARVDGNNETTEYVYDSLDRVIEKPLPGNEIVTYTYDNWDNLLTVHDPASTEEYLYDRLNRITAETHTIADLQNIQLHVGREYYRDGQLKNLTDTADRTVNYIYNSRGLIESVNFNNRPLVSYSYTNFNALERAAFQNGITTTYSYDTRHRLDTLTTRSGGQQSLFSHNYDYDRENNRTQLIEQTEIGGAASNRTVNYAYDPLEQLATINYSDIPGNTDLRFDYDTWGNRQTLTSPSQSVRYSYAANSQELESYTMNNRVRVGIVYDGNGNMISENYERLGHNTKNVNYEWDSRERLKRVEYQDRQMLAALPALPVNTLEFTYNDAGNRIKKSIIGGGTTYYLNAGLHVLNELDAQGNIIKTVVQGLSQVAEIDAEGHISFVHSDGVESAVFTSDEAGAVLQQYDYDPFGNIIGALGASNSRGQTKYQFTGQEFDSESNLNYFNARYYNPVIGRFISRDRYMGTAGDTISRNRYVYVKNNPLKYLDPTGNFEKQNEAVCNCSDEVFVTYSGEPEMMIASANFFNYVMGIDTAHAPGFDHDFSEPYEGTAWTPGGPITDVGEFTDASDFYTIFSGKNLDETEATTFDKGLAWGGFIIPGISGKGIKRFFTKGGSKATKETVQQITKHADDIGLQIIQGNSEKGITHIINRHAFTSTANNVGKFLESYGEKEIRALIEEAASKGSTWVNRPNGLQVLDINVGRVIGTNQSNVSTTWLKIVKDPATSELITAYPIVP